MPFLLKVSVIADDILKNVEFDALRIVYNKFQSVVSFLPTMSTVLSPEVPKLKNLVVHYVYFYCESVSWYKSFCGLM